MSPAHESATQVFTTVRVSRASDDIVRQIKAHIFDGKLAPGNRLPSEKALAAQFGLSRTTVRDALRVLESQGLIAIKVGAGGGNFVADPSARRVSDILTALLRLNAMTARELVEARLVVEISIIRLAAERATPQDIEALRQAIANAQKLRAAGDPHFSPSSIEFHTALAQAAKNQVLLFTIDSLRTIFHETLDQLLPDSSMAERAIEDHQKILDAIIARDAECAAQVMREHLQYLQQRVEKLETHPEP